jgi:hypothetical protein
LCASGFGFHDANPAELEYGGMQVHGGSVANVAFWKFALKSLNFDGHVIFGVSSPQQNARNYRDAGGACGDGLANSFVDGWPREFEITMFNGSTIRASADHIHKALKLFDTVGIAAPVSRNYECDVFRERYHEEA